MIIMIELKNKNALQQAIYKMRVFRLTSKFRDFSQVLYRGMRTRLRKSRTLHIAVRWGAIRSSKVFN